MTRRISILIFAIISFSCSRKYEGKVEQDTLPKIKQLSSNQVSKLEFRTLDKKEILIRLFNSSQIDDLGMVLWKPTENDSVLSTPISFDHKYHTSLDSIISFTDTQKRKCAIAIFSTYNFRYDSLNNSNIEVTGCHFCGASIGIGLFYKTDEQWKMYKFEKEIFQLGYFGQYKDVGATPSKIELIKIGDEWSCLSLTQGLGGNGGYLEGSQTLYSIEEFHLDNSKCLPLTAVLSNFYSNKEEYFKNNGIPQLKIIKKKNSYYDIKVKIVDAKSIGIKTYTFSPKHEEYIEK